MAGRPRGARRTRMHKAGIPLVAGGVTIRPVKPEWARFAWPGEAKAAE